MFIEYDLDLRVFPSLHFLTVDEIFMDQQQQRTN